MTTLENNEGADARLDDAAMFDALANGEDIPPEPEQQQEEAPVAEEPAREPKAEEPPPAAQQEPQQEHRVPLREMLDERERRQAAEREATSLRQQWEAFQRQLAQQQQKPKQDFWEAPENAIDDRIAAAVAPFQQAIAMQQEMFSRARAEDKYGAEVVDAAYRELAGRFERGDPSAEYDKQRIMSSPHPFGALVEWHKQQSLLKEIGTDPNAYHEKLLSDPAFLAKAIERANAQARGNAPLVSLPTSQKQATSLPSVSKLGAAAPIGKTQEEDLDDAALWDMLAKPARK